MKFWSTVILAGGLACTATAHTWVEQLMVIAANGTMVGQPGFIRGNVLRSSPGFGDPEMVNLIPGNGRVINDIEATDLMCKDSQTTQSQTSGSPRLQAPAGANVALRYQENGHVTLPQNQPGKPDNRGTVYVYGTTQPQADDKFLSIHRVWNADGTGGDGRGVLLSTQNFDDGQCYQVNGGTISTQRQKTFAHTATSLTGADLWCQQDIKIPTTAPSGKPYTLYWVWDWPTLPGTAGFPQGKQEIYTSCMDIDVVSGSGASSNVAANAFVQGQDLNAAAIPTEFGNIANPTAVVGKTIAFSAASGVPSATDTSGTSLAPSSAPATDASPENTDLPSSGFSSFFTETATAGVAASSAATQQPAATTANPTSGAAVIPFIPVGSGTQAVGETTNAASRPSVAPVTSTGAPFAQTSAPPAQQSGGRNHGQSGSFAFNPAAPTGGPAAPNPNANTGTAIAAPFAGPSTVTRMHTDFSTIFHTRMQTVYQTLQKRDEAGGTTEGPLASATSTAARCSKTESAYKLRARSPFYILPFGVSNSHGDC